MSIKAKDIIKTYRSGQQAVVALDKVSFEIEKGSFTVVLGPSGSGKSTLFNIISGIDSFDSGSLVIDDQNIETMNMRQLDQYRKDKVSMIFQAYNLLPDLTVYENIKLVADLAKDSFSVDEILERLSIKELRNRFPYELSGGQQQRTAIARAIVKKPTILLCDEPTAALDSSNSIQVLSLLKEVNEKFSTTVFLITHNDKISKMADTIMHLCDGRIVKVTSNTMPVLPAQLEWTV